MDICAQKKIWKSKTQDNRIVRKVKILLSVHIFQHCLLEITFGRCWLQGKSNYTFPAAHAVPMGGGEWGLHLENTK